jgi:hypothetical protein
MKMTCLLAHIVFTIFNMAMTISVDNLDKLNARKIRKIFPTQEDIIRFLQDLKLLPKRPKKIEQYGEHDDRDWYMAKVVRLTDSKLE